MLAVVGLPAAALAVLITASIVIELLATRGPASSAGGATPVMTPAEITQCHRDVEELLGALVREVTRLEELPLAGAAEDLGAQWDTFGQSWDESWAATEARCRFGALAEHGLGRTYDRAAWVHRSLPRTKLKYGHQLARFSRDLADEVAGMRRALEEKQ